MNVEYLLPNLVNSFIQSGECCSGLDIIFYHCGIKILPYAVQCSAFVVGNRTWPWPPSSPPPFYAVCKPAQPSHNKTHYENENLGTVRQNVTVLPLSISRTSNITIDELDDPLPMFNFLTIATFTKVSVLMRQTGCLFYYYYFTV